MLLSIDGTLVVQLINFIIFLVILNAIFLKPVGAAIAKRRAYIDGLAADLERFEGELKSLRAQGDERIAAARRAAEAQVGAARAEAQREALAILAEHEAQAAVIVAQAHESIGLEAQQARSDEASVVESLARTMLERAVGPELAV